MCWVSKYLLSINFFVTKGSPSQQESLHPRWCGRHKEAQQCLRQKHSLILWRLCWGERVKTFWLHSGLTVLSTLHPSSTQSLFILQLCHFWRCSSLWKNRTEIILIVLCSSPGKWDWLASSVLAHVCWSWGSKAPVVLTGRGKGGLEAAPSSWTCLDWHSLCKQPWLQSRWKMYLSP